MRMWSYITPQYFEFSHIELILRNRFVAWRRWKCLEWRLNEFILIVFQDANSCPAVFNKILLIIFCPGTNKGESSDTTHPASEVTTTPGPNTENPYSTSRNSKLTTFAWKSKIDLQYLLRVQDLCYKPMQKLGYNLIRDQEERDNPDFSVLGKSAQEISELNFNQWKICSDNNTVLVNSH